MEKAPMGTITHPPSRICCQRVLVVAAGVAAPAAPTGAGGGGLAAAGASCAGRREDTTRSSRAAVREAIIRGDGGYGFMFSFLSSRVLLWLRRLPDSLDRKSTRL